ncbi:MAG: hypothetical protein JNK78_12250 [Planctomycetes bacterium]|nr:hypothetical protein [Planctomycetota bacterium]
MSASSQPLIDPKDVAIVVRGFVLGFVILGFFLLLAMGLGMPLLVNHGNVPMQ